LSSSQAAWVQVKKLALSIPILDILTELLWLKVEPALRVFAFLASPGF